MSPETDPPSWLPVASASPSICVPASFTSLSNNLLKRSSTTDRTASRSFSFPVDLHRSAKNRCNCLGSKWLPTKKEQPTDTTAPQRLLPAQSTLSLRSRSRRAPCSSQSTDVLTRVADPQSEYSARHLEKLVS